MTVESLFPLSNGFGRSWTANNIEELSARLRDQVVEATNDPLGETLAVMTLSLREMHLRTPRTYMEELPSPSARHYYEFLTDYFKERGANVEPSELRTRADFLAQALQERFGDVGAEVRGSRALTLQELLKLAAAVRDFKAKETKGE